MPRGKRQNAENENAEYTLNFHNPAAKQPHIAPPPAPQNAPDGTIRPARPPPNAHKNYSVSAPASASISDILKRTLTMEQPLSPFSVA